VVNAPQAQEEDDNENEEENDDGAAYERMKKRLVASKLTAEAQKAEGTRSYAPLATTTASSEDEDEMPVNVRRHAAKKAKSKAPSASPSPSIRSRRSSPGLFVTPNPSPVKSRARVSVESGSDESSGLNADLQARVRRIRAERLAKKKEEEQAQTDANPSRRQVHQESGSDSDGENGRRLTQQAKPTRKAGKKAMELMARDQQRISRNMQLTHQAKTKKKYGLDQLFSRFSYNAPNAELTVTEGLPTPEASSALSSSDVEINQIHDTPPASSPRQGKLPAEEVMDVETTTTHPAAAPLSVASILPTTVDKGKGRAPEFQHLPPHPWMKKGEQVPVRSALVDVQKPVDQPMVDLSDSDDELEIVQPKSRFPVFDRIPLKKQQESSSLLHLRHLAHLTSSKDSRKGVKSVSLGEMQRSLAQKAREQGQKEREEKIAELKRRGIHVETEEEREKNQMEIEDMVAQFEKQRQEDLKLAKTERDEAKKSGETIDGLPSSDESDGDYVGSDEENANEVDAEAANETEVELELSGSEDEGMEPPALDVDSEEEDKHQEDKEDTEPAAREQQVEEDGDMEDEVIRVPVRKRTVTRPRNIVVDEEDESDNETPMPASPTQQASQNDAMAAFGFGNASVGLGLTQMFAGTMANLKSGSQPTGAEPEQDSLDFLRSLPDTQPGANFTQDSDYLVPNSQSMMSPQKESQTGLESQFTLGISQVMKTSPEFSHIQLDDDLPEPTQDAGFSFSRSPAGLMHPPSTVDTIMMSVAESPIKQRKGKLQRGRRDVEEPLDPEADLTEEDDIQVAPKPRDAFAKLQKGAKKQKAMAEYNKKTSLAKDAVMDQAEESEDEYAGLGGASDDDSGLEDEETKNMIEHGEVDVDERQIAAFFA
jgi:mediator of replication checkpoint protein 1